MLNWFLGLAGIIMGVAIGQAVTNGTEGQRDTGRKFVLESFFSGSVPPAATSCYVSNGDMKYCMSAKDEAHDGNNADSTKLKAIRSSNKNGLVAYGLGMRASNDESLWLRGTTPDVTKVGDGTVNSRNNDDARSTWSMAGVKNKFFISYNIEKDWFSDNEVVGKLMAAKIARSSANVIGVVFSTGTGGETVYWEYGEETAAHPLFDAAAETGEIVTGGEKIKPAEGTKDSPMITVFYKL